MFHGGSAGRAAVTIWSAVHGLAVLATQRPLREVPDAIRRRLEDLTFTFIGEGVS